MTTRDLPQRTRQNLKRLFITAATPMGHIRTIPPQSLPSAAAGVHKEMGDPGGKPIRRGSKAIAHSGHAGSHSCHFLPSAHPNLCAVIELEINLVHELSHDEYPPAVHSHEIAWSNRIGQPIWIEPRARVLDTHE